jgi:hypothetical protein
VPDSDEAQQKAWSMGESTGVVHVSSSPTLHPFSQVYLQFQIEN